YHAVMRVSRCAQGDPWTSTKTSSRPPPRRWSSPSWPRTTPTATRSSSAWASFPAASCSGPTACSTRCSTVSSARVTSRAGGGSRRRAASGSTIASRRRAGRSSPSSVSSGRPWTRRSGTSGWRCRFRTFRPSRPVAELSPDSGSSDALEGQIDQWRTYLRRRQAIHPVDVDELEDHLRGEVATMRGAGLSEDEAFLVAVKRMGAQDAISNEFAREHSERLWKQLVIAPSDPDEPAAGSRTEMIVVFALAVVAGAAIKVPELFGLRLAEGNVFYVRNFSLFVLPVLTGYFVWKRRLDARTCLGLALAFAGAAVFANAYPFGPESDTQVLA